MKAKLVMIIALGCLTLFISSHSFASGCGCARRVTTCPDTRCTPPDNPCDCTDPGWRWNTCMSKSKYCEAFGNVGGLDE